MIAMALEIGLRRREIYELDVDAVHPDNAYVVVPNVGRVRSGAVREVPFTAAARRSISAWLEIRALMGITGDRPWVALHAGPHAGTPMKQEAFEKLLRTYLASGWTLKRLRDTCALRWSGRGMPPETLGELLGVVALQDVVPYMQQTIRDPMKYMEIPAVWT